MSCSRSPIGCSRSSAAPGFHDGPAAPLLTDLDYRKKILWM
jgi:hypothetical protein